MTERLSTTPDTELHEEHHAAIERYADLGLGSVADGQIAYGARRPDSGPTRRPSRSESMQAHPSARRRTQESQYEPADPNYDVRSAGLSDEQIRTNARGIALARAVLSQPTDDPLEIARRRAYEERKKRP